MPVKTADFESAAYAISPLRLVRCSLPARRWGFKPPRVSSGYTGRCAGADGASPGGGRGTTTGVVGSLQSDSGMAGHVDFDVDRPCLFFIRDVPTGAVLFAGRVVDPTAS
jgi:hypothetical protein